MAVIVLNICVMSNENTISLNNRLSYPGTSFQPAFIKGSYPCVHPGMHTLLTQVVGDWFATSFLDQNVHGLVRAHRAGRQLDRQTEKRAT